MELTRAEVESLANGAGSSAMMIWTNSEMQKVASQLLIEMDKPKNDVWKDAPEDANRVDVYFFPKDSGVSYEKTTYNRELPKTLERKLAEEAVKDLLPFYSLSKDGAKTMENIIEIALLKARDEYEKASKGRNR